MAESVRRRKTGSKNPLYGTGFSAYENLPVFSPILLLKISSFRGKNMSDYAAVRRYNQFIMGNSDFQISTPLYIDRAGENCTGLLMQSSQTAWPSTCSGGTFSMFFFCVVPFQYPENGYYQGSENLICSTVSLGRGTTEAQKDWIVPLSLFARVPLKPKRLWLFHCPYRLPLITTTCLFERSFFLPPSEKQVVDLRRRFPA